MNKEQGMTNRYVRGDNKGVSGAVQPVVYAKPNPIVYGSPRPIIYGTPNPIVSGAAAGADDKSSHEGARLYSGFGPRSSPFDLAQLSLTQSTAAGADNKSPQKPTGFTSRSYPVDRVQPSTTQGAAAESDNKAPKGQRFTDVKTWNNNIRAVRDAETGRTIYTNLSNDALVDALGARDISVGGMSTRVRAGQNFVADENGLFLQDKDGTWQKNFYQRPSAGLDAPESGGSSEPAGGSRWRTSFRDIGSQKWRPLTAAIADNRRAAAAKAAQQNFKNRMEAARALIGQSRADSYAAQVDALNNKAGGFEMMLRQPETDLNGNIVGGGGMKLKIGDDLFEFDETEWPEIESWVAEAYDAELALHPDVDPQRLLRDLYREAAYNYRGGRVSQ